jgi:hypothetical protein
LRSAYNLLREFPHYRREAFDTGLRAAGFKVEHNFRQPKPGDVLLIWNRYGGNEFYARDCEKAGATVLVAENGYYSEEKTFAISLNQHHHGGNHIPGVRKMVTPRAGKHILVCDQRGIGSALMASPGAWAETTAEKLRRITKRTVVIREHPGKDAPRIPLADDLIDCHACVIWSSSAGVEALIRGVQVFYDAPRWIAEESAKRLSLVFKGSCDINALHQFDNAGINNALSNQWTAAEVAAGEPFFQLLGVQNEEKNKRN